VKNQGKWQALKLRQFAAPGLILLCVLAFYWIPLTSPNTTAYGDTIDVSYPLQKYFAQHALGKGLPFWTPYIYSGYPLLANPLNGAWYPLNWPFYITGVTPQTMEMELALHALLACLGMFFFLTRQVRHRTSAVLGAFAYGLSGFFAGHTSHLGVFCTAAWLPWILLAYRRATESKPGLNLGLGGLAAGCMMAAGFPQTAITALVALLLYALSDVLTGQIRILRAFGFVAVISVGAVGATAVQSLPASELASLSVSRPTAEYQKEALQPKHLLTLLWADSLGTLSHNDKDHPTDHYFYAGLLLLPLAIAGIAKGRARAAALLLLIPAVWYMAGPKAGLFYAGVLVPGVAGMGPPLLGWFIAAFALALAAAAGADWFTDRAAKFRYAGVLLAAVVFADLFFCNSFGNPLAYLRMSYYRAYGFSERVAARLLAAPQLPLNRFDAPNAMPGAGPLMHPLDLRFETTYGYFVDEPRSYREYHDAARTNTHLLDGLNVSRFVDWRKRDIDVNPNVLPRIYFPAAVQDVAGVEESRRLLPAMRPAEASTVFTPHAPIQQDKRATAVVVTYDEQSYRVHYTADSPSLLKLSMAWYPGWTARVGGRETPVLRVDHAMMGVVVPAGERDVEFRFHSRWFVAGTVISIATALILLSMVIGHQVYGYLDRVLFRPTAYRRRRRTKTKVSRAAV